MENLPSTVKQNACSSVCRVQLEVTIHQGMMPSCPSKVALVSSGAAMRKPPSVFRVFKAER